MFKFFFLPLSSCLYVFVLFFFLVWGMVLLFFWPFIFLWFCSYNNSALTHELITRFLASHLMDVKSICYPQYWLQGDVEDNSYQHLMLINAHYYSEKLLGLIKTLKASSPLTTAKNCPTIMFTNDLNMQFSLFKITM